MRHAIESKCKIWPIEVDKIGMLFVVFLFFFQRKIMIFAMSKNEPTVSAIRVGQRLHVERRSVAQRHIPQIILNLNNKIHKFTYIFRSHCSRTITITKWQRFVKIVAVAVAHILSKMQWKSLFMMRQRELTDDKQWMWYYCGCLLSSIDGCRLVGRAASNGKTIFEENNRVPTTTHIEIGFRL